jgi:hypothetical protein
MRGYSVFRVPTEALGPTSGKAVNPQVGPIFCAPLSYLDLFTRQSTTGPREVLELEVQEGPPSTLRNIDDGPMGGAGAEGPGVPTINVNTSTRGPREVSELKVRKRPPST